jgi:CBS domain-containing protein
MLVKDIMSTKVEAVRPTTTVGECARKMEQLGVGARPVWQDGQSLGLVTDRDIYCRVVGAGKDPAKTAVREIMTEAGATCFEDQDCGEAAHVMTNKQPVRVRIHSYRPAFYIASTPHDVDFSLSN